MKYVYTVFFLVPFVVWGQPENDHFVDRISLPPVLPLELAGTTILATEEPGDPSASPWEWETRGTVWWSWSSPADQDVLLWMSDLPIFLDVRIFTGDALLDLVETELLQAGYRFYRFTASAGETYQIEFFTPSNQAGDFQWGLFAAPPRPMNETFETRIPLYGGSVRTEGSLYGSASGELWWTWMAPSNCVMLLSGSGIGPSPDLELFTGPDAGSLSLVPSRNSRTPSDDYVFDAVAGEHYRIRVSWFLPNDAEAFVLDLFPTSYPVPHTSAESALAIPSLPTLVQANDWGILEGWGFPGTERSLWWFWTAPSNQWVRLEVNSGTGLSIEVNEGSPPHTSDSYVGSTWRDQPVFNFPAFAGQTYFFNSWRGQRHLDEILFTLTPLSVPPVPPNDNFANRTILTGVPVQVVGSNLGATLEAAEPFDPTLPPTHTVWWQYDPPSDFLAQFDTIGSGLDNTRITLFTGSSLNTLTFQARNDDLHNSRHSRVFLPVAPGVPVMVRVEGVGSDGTGGPILLNVQAAPPTPANDHFANRALLSGLPVSVEAHNIGSTREVGEPQHGEWGDADRTVWWTWTAPQSGAASVQLSEADADLAVSVYIGGSLATLSRVARGAYVGDPASFTVSAGQVYQIAVTGNDSDSYWADQGYFTLSVIPTPFPANDAFANATPILHLPYELTGNNTYATAEPGEPWFHTKTTWWRWTAPRSQPVRIVQISFLNLQTFHVYRGNELASLEEIWGVSGFNARAGVTYHFMLSSVSGHDFHFRIEDVEPLVYLPPPVRTVEVNPLLHTLRWESSPPRYYQPYFSTNWIEWHTIGGRVPATGGETQAALPDLSSDFMVFRVEDVAP